VQISIEVPYDEQLLRRTLRFLMRGPMRKIRICGVALIAVGLVLLAVIGWHPEPLPIGVIALGLAFLIVIEPMTLAQAMRQQSSMIRSTSRIMLDNEWASVTFPLCESRMRWAGVARVVETPEVWYVMFGKVQAMTIPKNAMTDEQRAELAEFLRTVKPTTAAAGR
jgi:hypothetical protein